MKDEGHSVRGRSLTMNASADCHERALRLVGKFAADRDARFRHRLARFSSLSTGDSLKLMGEPSDATYLVERGAVKWTVCKPQGEMEVSGLYLPGAVICLATLQSATCGDALEALESTSLCYVRSRTLPHAMNREIARLCSAQLRDTFAFHLSVATLRPGQRLAAFLLRMSAQFGRVKFHFSLSNSDTAEFLGCSLPDVTTSLHQFAAQGWILDIGHRFRLLDAGALLRYVEINPIVAT